LILDESHCFTKTLEEEMVRHNTATEVPGCFGEQHPKPSKEARYQEDQFVLERAAAIFRALGDFSRLRLLSTLMDGEKCVTELTEALDDNLPAISQRLKLLRSERIVKTRRQGKHIFYALADDHVAQLISNALAHGKEASPDP
jgi:ArsR family transcriptional regulator, lead/cadmium/zinc/bismuth-responsive transcriptional repressor